MLVGIPSMPYDLCHWPQAFESDVGAGPYRAMDAARNRILDDPTRLIKYFYLRFPTPPDSQTSQLELSTKEIYDNYGGDETELDLVYTDFTVKHDEHDMYHEGQKVNLPFKNQYASWNVVRSDVESSKRGRPDIGPKPSKAQAARIRKAAEEHERDQERRRMEHARFLAEQAAKSTNPDQVMSSNGN